MTLGLGEREGIFARLGDGRRCATRTGSIKEGVKIEIMRVVYHHRTRGTDAQRLHILAIVKALRRLGCEVEVAGLVDVEQERQPEEEAELTWWQKLVRRVPFANEVMQLGYNLVGLPLLWKKVSKKTDLIYERYSLFNFAGVLVARWKKIPLILEVNSPLALEQHRDREVRSLRLAMWAERTVCNMAGKVLVVSTPLKRIMEANGVDSRRMEVMTNGVDEHHLQDFVPAEELRERLGLRGQVVVGFLGWFRGWHSLEMLVEAFAQARGRNGSGKLLLIGDGPLSENLRRLVEQLGLSGDVVFAGAVPHDRLTDYLSLVDIAVQPGANEYCCPMKILEYMAYGKAIVAPQQENIEELLESGVEALYFRPGDGAGLAAALTELLEDAELRRRLGINARAAVRRRGLLWINNARRVLELAEQLRAEARAEPGSGMVGFGGG